LDLKPVLTFGAINSILLGVYSHALNYLDNDSKNPKLSNVAIAGMVTGAVTAIPTNPIEVIKLQMQTHSKTTFLSKKIKLNSKIGRDKTKAQGRYVAFWTALEKFTCARGSKDFTKALACYCCVTRHRTHCISAYSSFSSKTQKNLTFSMT
jgi:hypothetical protein